jgi:hypothetical protein
MLRAGGGGCRGRKIKREEEGQAKRKGLPTLSVKDTFRTLFSSADSPALLMIKAEEEKIIERVRCADADKRVGRVSLMKKELTVPRVQKVDDVRSMVLKEDKLRAKRKKSGTINRMTDGLWKKRRTKRLQPCVFVSSSKEDEKRNRGKDEKTRWKLASCKEH